MSYNGSGTFLINTAGQPVVSGTVISSTAFNALTADLATGLSTAITKDGQTTITANIPMANYKFTGLGAGSGAADSANLSQVQSTAVKLLASVSGADTITAVGSPTVAAYAAGQMFYFVAAGANTGAVTINIDSLGAKNITRDGTTALAAGDIQSGEVCVIVYDGTQFQLVNGASQSASIVTENLTVNKATVLNESGGDNDTRIEGDTEPNLFFVDASADSIGIGTNTPSSFANFRYLSINGTTGSVLNLRSNDVTQFEINTTGSANNIQGITNIPLVFWTNNTERMRLDSSGNLGLGVTPSAWTTSFGIKAIDVGSRGSFYASDNDANMSYNAYFDGTNSIYKVSAAAGRYAVIGNEHKWYTAASGSAGGTITFGDPKMTLDTSGNLAVGTTSPEGKLHVSGSAASGEVAGLITNVSGTGSNNTAALFLGIQAARAAAIKSINVGSNAHDLAFFTNGAFAAPAERARITSGGDLLVGKSASAIGDPGTEITSTGLVQITRDSAVPVIINRLTNDGDLISFRQASTEEGTISVSGNTVSYNPFMGSHYTEIVGTMPTLKGTVLESLDEFVSNKYTLQDRLPKAKISDTVGSSAVYGVYFSLDSDPETSDGILAAALGASWVRIASGVTVQRGDLLESNGDGCAKVQSDDIIRSKTIGKVTSAAVADTYADGSYIVPCVLYCG